MSGITASMVKELREKTGAGMMDAKKALVENNGDLEQAVDWLRTKGLAKAAKKSGRTAAEGLVALSVSGDGKQAVALEVNAETDFVARNEQFQSFVAEAAQLAMKAKDIDALSAMTMSGGKSVADTLTELIATIGENMALRRFEKQHVADGLIAAYVHNALAPNMGKIGVLVACEGQSNADVAKQIAMHVAAANPEFLNIETVPADALDRERSVLLEQAKAEGKPEEIAEKMVTGRIKKYYTETVLNEQVFVMDNETKIADLTSQNGMEISGFTRMVLGEGIEKEETDFAAEVAQAVNG